MPRKNKKTHITLVLGNKHALKPTRVIVPWKQTSSPAASELYPDIGSIWSFFAFSVSICYVEQKMHICPYQVLGNFFLLRHNDSAFFQSPRHERVCCFSQPCYSVISYETCYLMDCFYCPGIYLHVGKKHYLRNRSRAFFFASCKISLNISVFFIFFFFRDLFFHSNSYQLEEFSFAFILILPRKKFNSYGASMIFFEKNKQIFFNFLTQVETSNVSFSIFSYFRDLIIKIDSDKLKELFWAHLFLIIRK